MSLALSRSLRTHLIFGCGYLGRRVAALWSAQETSVIAVTRSPDHGEQFRRDGLIPHIADICDPASLRGLPEVDTVLFAVGYDRTAGRAQHDVFVDGLANVLTEIGARCRRFLYVSSTSVYGQQDGSWIDETSPCEPVQPGGVCCRDAEKLLPGSTASSHAVILRMAGIYGPGRLLSRVTDLQSGTPIAGRPETWLNLIHVDDAAQAVIDAAQTDRLCDAPRVLLVCDDRPVQRGEYYAHLARLVGAPPPQFDPDQPSRRAGGLNKRCSNRLMKSELGVKLRYPTFETGLPAALAATDELDLGL
jgi:nucleoside-diphosphate-sugar epimerase